ncbi:MAG TPA: acyl-CoA dehydrogenase family protein, partial [Phototrophicaceae bacterium]|nr:acyl-CoA dehydrogenase family protein [Phototrophicaceae bacterium]
MIRTEDHTTNNRTAQGRADLQAWEQSKPNNFFAADVNLQYVLRRYLGEARYAAIEADLMSFGAACATVIDQAAKQEDLIGNHPRLQRYSGIGERIESIEFHPNHDLIGKIIWRHGMMTLQAKPGNTVHQMALFYLLNHNGEAGHACSIACTAGLIRAVQQYGDPALKTKFLPPLLNPDYSAMQHGAQFLTEVQGGSDVGANAVEAQDYGDGTWRINGEKWFCSNINAQQFLVMARPVGAADGTRGLGAFLIPRTLDNGDETTATNGFYIRRLKEKLGTRTMASAELDFKDAVAYPIGAVDNGFKITVELVLNTSRLMNAVSCAGVMRRAALEAGSYACTRRAFDQPIADYPLVQEAIADMMSENYAAVASGFALAALMDSIETGQSSADDQAVYRLLVNLNKYITSIRGSEMVHRAIEVLGGNGAIETFSILPRLYRDMVVLESWEGTHNVLCLQVLRDIGRYALHEPYLRYLQSHLNSVIHPDLQEMVAQVRQSLHQLPVLLGKIAGGDSHYQQAHARRLADELAHLGQAVLLLAEAQFELDYGLATIKPDIIAYFVNRHLNRGYDPLEDEGYIPRLSRIMAAV